MGSCVSKQEPSAAAAPVMAYRRPPQPGFVYLENGNLKLLHIDRPLRFASFNAPELTDGTCFHPFEVRVDLVSQIWPECVPGDRYHVTHVARTIAGLGVGLPLRVTRTYTLRVKSQNFPNKAHIMGWDDGRGEWQLDEECWRELDHVFAEASKYDVKLIVPIINQCTGRHSNWVGDTVDICCLRHGRDYDDGLKTHFWTDRAVVDSYKKLISQYLNRVNTITGVRYGDDPTILAWQTGNEMNLEGTGKKPPPGSWTVEMAQHIKSLAPNTLVADGSFARTDMFDWKTAYAPEVLASPDVDILSYHFYSDEEGARAPKYAKLARKHGKAWISGEYGFFTNPESYERMLHDCDASGAAGSLIWSLRPHAGAGGFKMHPAHTETVTDYSYHCPGRPPPLPDGFDQKEAFISQIIRAANYTINGWDPDKAPAPPLAPPQLWAGIANNVKGLSWRGSAWATHYEIWEGDQCVYPSVHDSVPEGQLHVPVPRPGWYKIRAVGFSNQTSDFSNVVEA